MSDSPKEVFNLTRKQRLELIAALITDKMIEDMKQGYPLLRRLEAEEKSKRKSKRNKSLT